MAGGLSGISAIAQTVQGGQEGPLGIGGFERGAPIEGVPEGLPHGQPARTPTPAATIPAAQQTTQPHPVGGQVSQALHLADVQIEAALAGEHQVAPTPGGQPTGSPFQPRAPSGRYLPGPRAYVVPANTPVPPGTPTGIPPQVAVLVPPPANPPSPPVVAPTVSQASAQRARVLARGGGGLLRGGLLGALAGIATEAIRDILEDIGSAGPVPPAIALTPVAVDPTPPGGTAKPTGHDC